MLIWKQNQLFFWLLRLLLFLATSCRKEKFKTLVFPNLFATAFVSWCSTV